MKTTDPGHVLGLVGSFFVRETSDSSDAYDAVVDWLVQATAPKEIGVRLDRPILPPEVWIENPYYAGPFAGDFLWPKKKLAFIKAAQGDINEVLLTGCIGWGLSLIHI